MKFVFERSCKFIFYPSFELFPYGQLSRQMHLRAKWVFDYHLNDHHLMIINLHFSLKKKNR